jgi:hypothetical protein
MVGRVTGVTLYISTSDIGPMVGRVTGVPLYIYFWSYAVKGEYFACQGVS